MRMKSNRTILAALLVMVSLGSSLLSNSDITIAGTVAEQPRYGGTLVANLNGDIATFNSATTVSTPAHFPSDKILSSLMHWDAEANLVPDLAESYELSKDGLVYTFHLVKNAVWHDGKPFTSADVKFGIEEVIVKYHPKPRMFDALERVETPDSYTAVVRMKYPFPAFINFLGTTWCAIVPKHLYEGTDIMNNPYNMKPVGTGPFKFKEYVKGSHITLERNEKYFKKGKPYLDKIVYRIIPNDAARIMAFEKREIDYLLYQGLPLNEYERLGKLPDVKTVMLPCFFQGILMVVMNVRNPPLDNMKVRQAMAYAIDKKEILDKASFGVGKVATGPIRSEVKWAYNPNVPKYEKNLALANKLLDEAGYPKKADGIRCKTSITYDRAVPEIAKSAEVMRLQLLEVGIDVQLKATDVATYQEAQGRWDYDMIPSRTATGPDPSAVSAMYWGKNILKVLGANTGGYMNSRYDWLHEQAAQEVDQKKRAEYYFELQEIATKELPAFWLFELAYPVAFRTEFRGLPEGAYCYDGADDIWWTKGSEVSPEAIQSAITAAGKELEGLRGQFYDVTAAQQQLDQAKKALEAGDYVKANELVKGAVKLAQPPYALYGGAVTVLAAAGILLYRRKKKTKPA